MKCVLPMHVIRFLALGNGSWRTACGRRNHIKRGGMMACRKAGVARRPSHVVLTSVVIRRRSSPVVRAVMQSVFIDLDVSNESPLETISLSMTSPRTRPHANVTSHRRSYLYIISISSIIDCNLYCRNCVSGYESTRVSVCRPVCLCVCLILCRQKTNVLRICEWLTCTVGRCHWGSLGYT